MLIAKLAGIADKSPLEQIKRLTGRRVYITHGRQDRTLPVDHAHTLAACAQQNGVKLDTWLDPETDHLYAMLEHTDDYEQRLTAFFNEALLQ